MISLCYFSQSAFNIFICLSRFSRYYYFFCYYFTNFSYNYFISTSDIPFSSYLSFLAVLLLLAANEIIWCRCVAADVTSISLVLFEHLFSLFSPPSSLWVAILLFITTFLPSSNFNYCISALILLFSFFKLSIRLLSSLNWISMNSSLFFNIFCLVSSNTYGLTLIL